MQKKQKTEEWGFLCEIQVENGFLRQHPLLSCWPPSVVVGNPISKNPCSYEAVKAVVLILKQQHRFLIKDHGQCLGAMASNIYSRPKCFVKMMTSKIFFCCLHLATGKWIWQRVLISLKFNWYTSSTIHPINHVCMYTLKRYIFIFPNTLLNIIKFKKFAFTSF